MNIEIVTYANKSFGMFEDLIHNEYDVPITILGWGSTWNGYLDKSHGVLNHLNRKKDDDIIVVLDGFDTKINKTLVGLYEKFKSLQCRVLVSTDKGKFISKHIFGTCTKDNIANAGMYMGYVKEVRMMLTDIVNNTCKDDQRNLNETCKKYNFIKMDEKDIIFQNNYNLSFIMGSTDSSSQSKAHFISYPGTLSFQRIMRASIEYTQFIYIYIIDIFVILIFMFPNYRSNLVLSTITFILLFKIYADTSCIKQ